MKRTTISQSPPPKKPSNSLSIEETKAVFEKELYKRYWAEKELVALLPLLSKSATSYELNKAIESHLSITEKQLNRLLHIFDILEGRGVGQKYTAMARLINQGKDAVILKAGFERDNAIVAASTAIMLHELKSYKKLLVMAKYIKEDISAAYLAIAISEEQQAYELLNEITLSSLYFDKVG